MYEEEDISFEQYGPLCTSEQTGRLLFLDDWKPSVLYENLVDDVKSCSHVKEAPVWAEMLSVGVKFYGELVRWLGEER